MSSIHDLDTPAVLVDLDVVERNIARMAAWARDAGVALRPHAKTHKCERIARLQIAAGARGLCVAKVGEAEVFADHGFEDLFVAYPVVGEEKARRLLALSARARLSAGVDSVAGAASLSRVFAAAGSRLDVLIKVDVGFHRVGVPPEGAEALARAVTDLPGVRLKGLFTHAGQGYLAPTPDEIAEVGRHEGEVMSALAERMEASGIEVHWVSAGSTPTARHAMAGPGVDECRPGNYVFHDASQVSLGTCAVEDCALTVAASVVSVAQSERRAVVDAGSKTLSSDPLRPRPGGYGWILGTRSRLSRLSEEHGVIDVAEGDEFEVGGRVRILPNHACVVSNLHDCLHGVRGVRVEETIPVMARGRVR